jgi:hypothetical protein
MPAARLLPLLLLLCACGGPEKKTDPANQKDKYGRYPHIAEQYKEAVAKKKLLRGMHKGEIRQVMGGGPERTRKEKRGKSTYTVWVYASRSLDLWLDNDGYLMKWEGPY